MSTLAHLPPELYTAILNYIPQSSLQQTVLSLSRALPYSSIPLFHLFQHVRLTHADQAIQLYCRLRRPSSTPSTPDPATTWIRDFSLETWTVDADLVVLLIRLMPSLAALSMCIGPNSFAPEHLEEMFRKCIPGLKYLSLRFRPYVQSATYYQFLKGAYFDSTLIALSRWPPSALPTFSIVQDPLDPGTNKRAFAQPLVFFHLDPLTSLVCSPYLSSLTAFRLRIPSRQITRFITTHPLSLPSLQFLDLSSCNVLDVEVDTLLTRFVKLRHLVLDECAILRGESREGVWSALGKSCALVGVRRAKERERQLKAWLENNRRAFSDHQASTDEVQEVDTQAAATPRKARRGRRGLATATISLRQSPPRDSAPLPALHIPIPKIRILPPSPSLLSLATTTSTLIQPDKHPAVRAEFERGWADGLAQLVATRTRLRQSSMNGVRIVQFVAGVDRDGMDGLEDVDMDDEVFRVREDAWKPPVLCLVGDKRDAGHVEGCGHAVGWEIWKNELF